MRLRNQLILAFVLLAVVPLGAITLYAYHSSTKALRNTVEAESARAAGEMESRMGTVTASLSRRIGGLEEIPFPLAGKDATAPAADADPQMIGRLLSTLGDAASLIEAFEFHPDPGAVAPAPPRPSRRRAAHAPKSPAHPRAPSAPGSALPIVVHLPKIAGELTKDPDVAPLIQAAMALIPPGEAARIEKDMMGRLGEQGQMIARIVKEKVEASRAKREAETEKAEKDDEEAALVEEDRENGLHLKQEFGCTLKRDGERVGSLKARVSTDRLLRQVLSQTRRDQGEIPFARDGAGNLFTLDAADLAKLKKHHLAGGPGEDGPKPDEQWVVVTHADEATGLTFGLARPVGESLGEIRRASARNLGAGLGLAAFALFGILPLSRRMTQNLSDLTRGAERLAAGRLDTQVPVRSSDELGQLAQAFNRMAKELSANQERLVVQERLRKELELCRRIQAELLPKKALHYPFAEVEGLSIPAHELGGDFFNYFGLPGGEVALLMGDVSGKGVPAALLMANLQATLRARLPLETDLAAFADRLDHEVEATTPTEVYLTLFLSILDPARRELRYINAGHESPFLLRSGGRVERLDPTGRPIGLVPGGGYTERRVAIGAGDRLFLYTDGLVDAENEAGDHFGAGRLETLLAHAGSAHHAGPGDGAGARDGGGAKDGAGAETLLARVERAYAEHRGKMDAADDATLLVLRVGDWAAADHAPRASAASSTEAPAQA
jgi:serine phosphatase RsbU (regulator of sigma subunit)